MKRTILILFVTSLLVGSCSFFNDDYRETIEQFVSVAYKSDNADFSQYETYVVADSILYVDGDKNVRKKNDLTDEVKSVIAGAMNALGYTPFIASSASSKPDLILDLSYIVSTTTTIYPGYWWGWDYWYYYDWFYPYFPYDPYYPGGFYPYYPYPMYPMVSSYSTGSLTIDMVDIKNLQKDSNPPIVWHGLVRSILTSAHTSEERADAIAQCFDMMPPVNTK
jgi:hypothetical protein